MVRLTYLLILICVVAQARAQTIVINSALLQTHKTKEFNHAKTLIKQGFNALDIDVEFQFRPNKRSIIEVNRGSIDGEYARIFSITERYTNVLIVPEPIAQVEVVAFSTKTEVDLTLFDLTRSKYRIGSMLGWKNTDDYLADYPWKHLISDHVKLFELLTIERIDLALYSSTAGKQILDTHFPEFNYRMSPPLFTYSVYLVLNKKHAALVKPLAAQFRALKALKQ